MQRLFYVCQDETISGNLTRFSNCGGPLKQKNLCIMKSSFRQMCEIVFEAKSTKYGEAFRFLFLKSVVFCSQDLASWSFVCPLCEHRFK